MLSTFVWFAEYGVLAVATALIQIAQAQSDDQVSDPLISRGGNIAIYVGLVCLVLVIAFAIKSFNTKVEHTLILAFGISVALIVILWYL